MYAPRDNNYQRISKTLRLQSISSRYVTVCCDLEDLDLHILEEHRRTMHQSTVAGINHALANPTTNC